MPIASEDLPKPPGEPSTVISPRTKSKPYKVRRWRMFEKLTLRFVADHVDGFRADGKTVRPTGGDRESTGDDGGVALIAG